MGMLCFVPVHTNVRLILKQVEMHNNNIKKNLHFHNFKISVHLMKIHTLVFSFRFIIQFTAKNSELRITVIVMCSSGIKYFLSKPIIIIHRAN